MSKKQNTNTNVQYWVAFDQDTVVQDGPVIIYITMNWTLKGLTVLDVHWHKYSHPEQSVLSCNLYPELELYEGLS